MFDIDWRGLILPFAYVLVLGGTFATFSTVYRKRKATQSANLSPWFPPHLQRNVYLSLLHMDPETVDGKTVKVPDSVIRAALLRRAVEDIHRIIQIRTGKQACAALLQRGSVGDDLWQRFQRAEREMEEELRDVVMEANALVPNWGQIIFQTANAIAANAALRTKLDAVQAQLPAEKAWWAERRQSIAKELLHDTTDGSSPAAVQEKTKDQQQQQQPHTDADAPASKAATAQKKAKFTPSPTTATSSKSDDGDAVLVDAPSAVPSSTPATPAVGHGSSKKKKGRK